MTQTRRDNHSTEFGNWLRVQDEIDSKRGFVATNVDYIWKNYKTGKWMIIEEKRYKAEVKFYQRKIFDTLDAVSQNDPHYKGMFILVFENASPDDGRIWLDGKEITKTDLIKFLQFDFSFSIK
jgi:hypothetical protein